MRAGETKASTSEEGATSEDEGVWIAMLVGGGVEILGIDSIEIIELNLPKRGRLDDEDIHILLLQDHARRGKAWEDSERS